MSETNHTPCFLLVEGDAEHVVADVIVDLLPVTLGAPRPEERVQTRACDRCTVARVEVHGPPWSDPADASIWGTHLDDALTRAVSQGARRVAVELQQNAGYPIEQMALVFVESALRTNGHVHGPQQLWLLACGTALDAWSRALEAHGIGTLSMRARQSA